MMRGRTLALLIVLPFILSCGRKVPTTGDEGMGRIKGIVVSEEGIPVDGAEVSLVERGETWITDAGGSFMIPDLPLGNMYSVLIRQGRKGAFVQGVIVDGEVDLGRITIKDVGSIRGQVVGDFEDEFSDAEVYLVGTPFSAKVGDDGRFVIGWVPEGEYKLRLMMYMDKEAEIGDVDVPCGREVDIGRKSIGRTRLAVLYCCPLLDMYVIKVMGINGDVVKEISFPETGCSNIMGRIALSPDGKKVAFIRRDSECIWVAEIDTGEKRIVARPPLPRPSSNPSGSPRLFTPPPSEFPDMPPLSKVVGEMFKGFYFHNLSWSPDGRWISAVLIGGDLKDNKIIRYYFFGVVVNPNGPPDQEPLLLSGSDKVMDVSWSPKGDAVAVVIHEGGETYIQIQRRDIAPLKIPVGRGKIDLWTSIFTLWSPDGGRIYYKYPLDGTIKVVDIRDGTINLFVGAIGRIGRGKVRLAGFTPGGKRIFVWEENEGGLWGTTLWAVRVDGSDQVKIIESYHSWDNDHAVDASVAQTW